MVIKGEKDIAGESGFQNCHTFNQNACKWEPQIVLSDHNDDSFMVSQMDPLKTPKSKMKINKSSSEVNRWASVVKSKKHQQSVETSKSDDQNRSKMKSPKMVDSVFKLLPKNFEAQKGFIVTQNTFYLCIPCDFEFDSVNSISNHLKTRKHEDCIISFLKEKLPSQLDSIMEYVSFFGFNLCCNLCHFTLAMSSYNPYETIVNIIAHNASKMHIDQKAACDSFSGDLTGISDLVTNTVVEGSKQKMTNFIRSDELELELLKKSMTDKKSLKRELELNKSVEVPVSQTIVKDKQSRLEDLLSSIPSGLAHIDCIVENDKGSITCLICNRVVPPSSQNLYSHLTGSNHKRNKDKSIMKRPQEKTKEKESSNSTVPEHFPTDAYEKEIVKRVPTFLKRQNKITKFQIPLSESIDTTFGKIMMNNNLISKNKNFLVANVDGRNSYCKLCKILVPLTADLNSLENSLVEHFQKVKHMSKFSKTEPVNDKKESRNVGSGRVSRSLFNLSDDDIKQEYDVDGSEAEGNYNSSKENEGLSIQPEGTNQPSTEPPQSSNDVSKQVCVEPSQHVKNKDDTLTKTFAQKPESKILRCFTVETEQDEAVLNRREKQISYGKNTEGYARYCQLVPRDRRGPKHPVTPPRHAKCSRRAFDGMVRVWRRQLHAWDPPQPPTLESFPWLTPLAAN